MNELIEIAKSFAYICHNDQKRKHTNEPYFEHPKRVVALLETIEHTDEMIVAAWLHDVLEDCHRITDGHILLSFGKLVCDYVVALTDTKIGNRKERKEYDLNRLKNAPPEVQSIKLADMIDNMPSIIEHDPNFSVVYMREKLELFKVLTKGDSKLRQMAGNIIDEYYSGKEK